MFRFDIADDLTLTRAYSALSSSSYAAVRDLRARAQVFCPLCPLAQFPVANIHSLLSESFSLLLPLMVDGRQSPLNVARRTTYLLAYRLILRNAPIVYVCMCMCVYIVGIVLSDERLARFLSLDAQFDHRQEERPLCDRLELTDGRSVRNRSAAVMRRRNVYLTDLRRSRWVVSSRR